MSKSFFLATVVLAVLQAQCRAANNVWKGWEGSGPPGWAWGVPELWWYRLAKVFSHDAEVVYRRDDATSFWVKARVKEGKQEGLFGVTFEWFKPLERGYAYKFIMRMGPADCLPDLVTVSDNVVWRRKDGYARYPEVEFEYVPGAQKEVARICLIKRCTRSKPGGGRQRPASKWFTLHPPHQGYWHPNNLRCLRAAHKGPRPKYERLALPQGTKFVEIERHLACSLLRNKLLVPTDYARPPLKKLPYPCGDVRIIEHVIPPADGKEYFTAAGIRAALFSGGDFEQWAKAAAGAGVTDLVTPPLLEERHWIRPEAPKGRYRSFHWIDIVTGHGGRWWQPSESASKIAQAVTDTVGVFNRWLELVPEGRIFLFSPEVNSCYGMWGNGISQSPLAGCPVTMRYATGVLMPGASPSSSFEKSAGDSTRHWARRRTGSGSLTNWTGRRFRAPTPFTLARTLSCTRTSTASA